MAPLMALSLDKHSIVVVVGRVKVPNIDKQTDTPLAAAAPSLFLQVLHVQATISTAVANFAES